jgi:hypothetical protein
MIMECMDIYKSQDDIGENCDNEDNESEPPSC